MAIEHFGGRIKTREEIGRERLEQEREVTRAGWLELARVCLECLGSCALGLLCLGYALHTTDPSVGAVAWWTGMLIGYGGITLSLSTGYLRGIRRGDW
jgi:hypothetical protein